MKTTPLWSPPQGAANTSRMAQFMAEINAEFGANLRSFADLHGFSVRETEAFWSKAWDFLGVIGEKGSGPVLRLGERFEDAKFFEGARLNYAENLLRKNDDNTALIFWGEDKVKKTMTWAQLHAAVSQAQQFLRAQGVREGDRVAALMPNKPEAVVGLACGLIAGGNLVERFARFRCARRSRPVRANRAQGLDCLRRLLLSLQNAPDWRQGCRNHREIAERRDCADRVLSRRSSSRF